MSSVSGTRRKYGAHSSLTLRAFAVLTRAGSIGRPTATYVEITLTPGPTAFCSAASDASGRSW